MFATIRKAGLSLDEYAVIVGVSRVAVFNWRAGRTKPHPQLKSKLDKCDAFLEKLLDLEKLPLKRDLARDERKAKIAKLKDAFNKFVG